MDPFTPGLDLQSSVWNTSERLDFELDGFDLEGPMRFIESAFPTTYSSPESARSLQDGPSFFASTGPAASLASTLNISTTLCDSEKTSLLWFQEEFYETIIRKDEDHKAFNLHFIQLANFEPLLQAVLAVGAAHRAQLGPGIKSSQDLVDEGLKLHSKAVRGLKISIDNKTKCSRNAIIACTFCLLFYELIQGGFSTVTTHHLLGALHLMKTDANAGRNKTSMFHHKLFRYYDVIAALSLGKNPITGSLTFEEDPPPPPPRNRDQTSPSIDPYGCVDNVFGLAKGLWPLLHRLAQLTKAIHPQASTFASPSASARSPLPPNTPRSQTHHAISLAALELSLKEWKPHLELHVANMEHAASDSRLQSLVQNAEAVRHAALVHLYARLLFDRPDTPRLQRAAKAALQACLRVMVFGAPFGGLLWALFTAGTCAVTTGDRAVARTVLQQLLAVQGMANIANASALLEEVWRRGDEEGFLPPWQDVARTKGWSVICA